MHVMLYLNETIIFSNWFHEIMVHKIKWYYMYTEKTESSWSSCLWQSHSKNQ